MREYQITFFVNDVNTSACIASSLIRLAKKFKSIIHIINITRNRYAQLNKSMAVLQAGLHPGDLCQITAIGIDAELACFVFKDIVSDDVSLISSNMNCGFSAELSAQFPHIHPPCNIDWHYAKTQTTLTKFNCLQKLAQLIHPANPDALTLAFIKREEYSSTAVMPGIALPHVIFDDIHHISIAVIVSHQAIDWESPLGNVHVSIGLVIPTNPSKSQIVTATNLSRNLLKEPIGERLLLTRHSLEQQTLLMYAASGLLP